jgi:hypothetical protein
MRLHGSTRRTLFSAGLTVALVMAAALGAAQPAGAAPRSCGADGNQPVNPSPIESSLSGLAVVSACDAFAVGSYYTSRSDSGALIERWNGSSWSVQPTPGLALNAVSMSSAANGWAVGQNRSQEPLIVHWDGKTWQAQRSRTWPGYTSLNGVAAISPDDAWAVGLALRSKIGIIEHWNGRRWGTVAPVRPAGAGSYRLAAIAAAGSATVWTVGTYYVNSWSRSLIEHWTGHGWQIVPSPKPAGAAQYGLTGVDVVTPRDIWAVGSWTTNRLVGIPLAEHWNGKGWHLVRVPQVSANGAGLTSVAALSQSNVWVAGTVNGPIRPGPPSYTLIEHWNGTKWQRVPSANPGPGFNQLTAIAGSATSNLWAVGGYTTTPEEVGEDQLTMALHCCRWQA